MLGLAQSLPLRPIEEICPYSALRCARDLMYAIDNNFDDNNYVNAGRWKAKPLSAVINECTVFGG